MTNSRQKGKRIEREACAFLRSLGFASARRGVQYQGGPDSPDVICAELRGIHVEVKGDQAIELGTQALEDAMFQAAEDAPPGSLPVVLWKKNRSAWRLTWDSTDDAVSPLGEKPVVTYTVAGRDDIRHVLTRLLAERSSDSRTQHEEK